MTSSPLQGKTIAFAVANEGIEQVDLEQPWDAVWPAKLPRALDVDLAELSRTRLSGGNIKNIVLAAAYLAAADKTTVTMKHLRHALRREYQKLGKDLGPGGALS